MELENEPTVQYISVHYVSNLISYDCHRPDLRSFTAAQPSERQKAFNKDLFKNYYLFSTLLISSHIVLSLKCIHFLLQ